MVVRCLRHVIILVFAIWHLGQARSSILAISGMCHGRDLLCPVTVSRLRVLPSGSSRPKKVSAYSGEKCGFPVPWTVSRCGPHLDLNVEVNLDGQEGGGAFFICTLYNIKVKGSFMYIFDISFVGLVQK